MQVTPRNLTCTLGAWNKNTRDTITQPGMLKDKVRTLRSCRGRWNGELYRRMERDATKYSRCPRKFWFKIVFKSVLSQSSSIWGPEFSELKFNSTYKALVVKSDLHYALAYFLLHKKRTFFERLHVATMVLFEKKRILRFIYVVYFVLGITNFFRRKNYCKKGKRKESPTILPRFYSTRALSSQRYSRAMVGPDKLVRISAI